MAGKSTVKNLLTAEPIVAALSALETNSESQTRNLEKMGATFERIISDLGRKIEETEHDFNRKLETFNTQVQAQFQNMSSKWESANASLVADFRAFASKLQDERRAEGRAPWALMLMGGAFILALVGAVGSLTYWPMSDRLGKVEDALLKLSDNQTAMREFVQTNFVSQRDIDARTMRGAEDRDRTNRAIEKIQENVFPKAVHEQRWLRFDSDIAATNLRMDTLVQNVQREIDALQKALGDTFTARDALLENKERIAKLEDLIRQLTPVKVAP